MHFLLLHTLIISVYWDHIAGLVAVAAAEGLTPLRARPEGTAWSLSFLLAAALSAARWAAVWCVVLVRTLAFLSLAGAWLLEWVEVAGASTIGKSGVMTGCLPWAGDAGSGGAGVIGAAKGIYKSPVKGSLVKAWYTRGMEDADRAGFNFFGGRGRSMSLSEWSKGGLNSVRFRGAVGTSSSNR